MNTDDATENLMHPEQWIPDFQAATSTDIGWFKIDALSTHQHPSVRLAIASNISTSHFFLERMSASETDESVLQMIEHRRFNLAKLVRILEHDVADHRKASRFVPFSPMVGALNEDELEAAHIVTGERSNSYEEMALSLTDFAVKGRRFRWLPKRAR